ncbi:site-specific integrase [Sporosarcina sp. NCCP-2222]|uniref:tyrosine-type recombinase/integrase n=1 Tax=Sporosarcina sp. NCCP-2222 TaxID=2935073 RepID=UPI002084E7AA|nr:site-specific integrase [Sporosarcina sp. NCCP-2222]GKV54284.1 site-specific integrase [Sporosarcina sp. NCCP-2222]
MYCRTLDNGKWVCTVDATPNPLTGERRQVTRRGATKKEAMRRAQKAADELSKERQTAKRTVLEVYDEWLSVYKETVKASSVKTRMVALKSFIDKHGKHLIGKLEINDIQKYLIERRDTGISNHHLAGTRTALNLMFDFAVKNDYVEKNIVKDTVVPKANKKSQLLINAKKKYLEKDEIQNFLAGVKSSGRRNAYPIALTMLSTGLRVGEVLALTWNDIDVERRELVVNKTLFEKAADEGGFEFVPPKTEDSNRTVSFNQKLAEELKRRKVQYNKEKLIGLRDPNSEWCDLVFTGRNQQPVRAVTIGSVFNAIYKAYGIKDVSGTHILRHTHITMLVEAGVDLPVIMERVGHSNINITLEIYTHVTKKMQQQSDDKINEYFRQFV